MKKTEDLPQYKDELIALIVAEYSPYGSLNYNTILTYSSLLKCFGIIPKVPKEIEDFVVKELQKEKADPYNTRDIDKMLAIIKTGKNKPIPILQKVIRYATLLCWKLTKGQKDDYRYDWNYYGFGGLTGNKSNKPHTIAKDLKHLGKQFWAMITATPYYETPYYWEYSNEYYAVQFS